nr:hypothetical protein [Tanacetum cinerariifolium]
MESSTIVSCIPTHRVHLDHPKDQLLGDLKLAVQTKRMAKKSSGAHAFVSYIHQQRRTNHKDYENCLFACFLSQMEPKKVSQALDDESWVEAIRTKWVYMNKKDERGILVRNKARLVAQGNRQEEGIDYASRPGIMFAVCACFRFQVTPKHLHLHAVKRIFRYLKVKQIHAIVDGKAVVISISSLRSDLLFNEEDGEGDSVERAITTDASLVTAQDIDNITKTQSTAMSNDLISQEIGSVDRPRCQETTLGGIDAQTRFESASKKSCDPSLSEVNTSRSGEDKMKHPNDLMDFVPPTPHDSPLSGGHTPRSDEDRPNLL